MPLTEKSHLEVWVVRKDSEAADPVKNVLPVDKDYPSLDLVLKAAWRQAEQAVADFKRSSPDQPFPAVQAYVVGEDGVSLARGIPEVGLMVAYSWDCEAKKVVACIDKS